MKKIYYSLIALGSLLPLLFSCDSVFNKEEDPDAQVESTMRGVFYTTVTGAENTLELLPGKSKSVDAQVRTAGDAVSDVTLKLSLKVDPDGVATYNSANGKDAVLLPSSAYAFVKNDMMLARYNTTSTSARISITAAGLENEILYVLPLTIDKVEGTDNWELADNARSFITVMQMNEETYQGPEGGDGTMEFPWELKTAQDLVDMADKLNQEEKVYFKMMNDIDMSEIKDWTPLNYASPYAFQIDFDGQGHTIDNFFCDFSSYPSFFGVLYGYCHDVTFTNAVIECGGDSGCGILGGYGGTGDKHADVARVHVHGKVTLTGNKTGVGGMFGCAGNASIAASSADVDVWSAKNYVGGLFGYSKKVDVSDCWTAGSVRGDQRVGGIAGGINGTGDSMVNCYSIAKLYVIKEDETKEYGCTRSVGGIIGHANLDKSDGNEERMPENVVKGCIAWEEEIITRSYIGAGVAPGEDQDWYSSGAIVAFGATHNTYADCYRRADLIFRDYSDAFLLYDQENTSPSAPLTIQPVVNNTHNYPYHGKAAPAGATVSQLAQQLGWSPAIWNFSGELPTIRPDAQVGPVPDVATDGQLPGFGENDLN